jgi:hypothetical protein
MRWKCLTALALILGGTVSSVVGCAGRDSSGAEKPRPATVPESPLGETVLVTEPRRGENGTTRRESAPAVHERIPPAPAVDLATLPPGPVTCSDCGPAPGYPSWQCPDGHQGGRGPCVRLSDGMCGWINLVCAGQGSCSASECGASPSPIEWRCPDEEHRGYFACVRGDDGRCGWTHSPCPKDVRDRAQRRRLRRSRRLALPATLCPTRESYEPGRFSRFASPAAAQCPPSVESSSRSEMERTSSRTSAAASAPATGSATPSSPNRRFKPLARALDHGAESAPPQQSLCFSFGLALESLDEVVDGGVAPPAFAQDELHRQRR